MWTCPKCGRIFGKSAQPHSCHSIPLEDHFRNKIIARSIFEHLVRVINKKIGKSTIISLPCCIHLFGAYDFLAALPKKNTLEVRIALDRKLDSPRLKQSVRLSARDWKNCIDIHAKDEIDDELIGWIRQSYFLKN